MKVRTEILKQAIGAVALSFTIAASAVSSPAQRLPGNQVLKQVADIPLPGPAVRFDYQSLDAKNGRLYIAHMNADHLVVFDTQKKKVIANLDGFKRVHGVIAVPEIDRVFASATGEHQVVAVDMNTLKIVGSQAPSTIPMVLPTHRRPEESSSRMSTAAWMPWSMQRRTS